MILKSEIKIGILATLNISLTFQIDGNGGGLISCGIIARSAGLFENSAKKLCACDGVPIWDERDREEMILMLSLSESQTV